MVIKDGENSLVSSFYFPVASFTSSKNKGLQLDIQVVSQRRRVTDFMNKTQSTQKKKVVAFNWSRDVFIQAPEFSVKEAVTFYFCVEGLLDMYYVHYSWKSVNGILPFRFGLVKDFF